MTNVTVNSDLYNAGLTQDGTAYIGEMFFVEVEFFEIVLTPIN